MYMITESTGSRIAYDRHALGIWSIHDISRVNHNHEICNVPIPPKDAYLDKLERRIRAPPLNGSIYELDPFHQVAQQGNDENDGRVKVNGENMLLY